MHYTQFAPTRCSTATMGGLAPTSCSLLPLAGIPDAAIQHMGESLPPPLRLFVWLPGSPANQGWRLGLLLVKRRPPEPPYSCNRYRTIQTHLVLGRSMTAVLT